MAPGALGDSNGGLSLRARPGTEDLKNIKVYSRRPRKKVPKTSNNIEKPTSEKPTSTTLEVSCTTFATTALADGSTSPTTPDGLSESPAPNRTAGDGVVEESLVRKDLESSNGRLQEQTAELQNLEDSPPTKEAQNCANELLQTNGVPNGGEVTAAIGNEPHNEGGVNPANINGVVKPLVISRVDDRIRFNLCSAAPKNEVVGLREKLEYELDQVRRLVKDLEAKELHLASSYNNTQISNNNLSNGSNYTGVETGANIGGYNSNPQPLHVQTNGLERRTLVRVNSEMGHQLNRPMGLARMNSDMGAARNLEPRPYSRQLSVAVMENNNHMADEFVEKEKRTPKANQYYRNSEFLLGKDRLPSESNKRLKTNNGRKHGEFGYGFDKSRNQAFRSCSNLLQKLMKHKFGWVFNEPVNAKNLGLLDYHEIIKHPMDLGTIKTRLSQNWYKIPREFAEDVRLVFSNAMTYNPKGQDVHVMAEQLLQIFEERWAVIETEYNPYWKYQMYQDAGLPGPTSRTVPVSTPAIPGFAPAHIPLYAPPVQQMAASMAVDPKFHHRPHVGRTPVPKKPKARDINKRDMTYEEKQRLSTHLQGMPAEKLDVMVQIIKRNSTAVSQHDDEIEVDIDSVDTETLWELDRFVTNYKKSLSKYKRKAELALQARMVANQNIAEANSTPTAAQPEIGTAFDNSSAPQAVEGEKQGCNGNRSSSSSSSSSDSGSSSSDSDSDSSSADGSDADQSPKT